MISIIGITLIGTGIFTTYALYKSATADNSEEEKQ